MPTPQILVTDLEGDLAVTVNPTVDNTDLYPVDTATPHKVQFPGGTWTMFSVYKKASTWIDNGTLTIGIGDPGYNAAITSDLSFSNILKANLRDADTGNLVGGDNIYDYIVLAKDGLGNAYLPDFDFDGIGDFTDGEGYTLKAILPCYIDIYGENFLISEGPYINKLGHRIDLPSGWSIMGYPCPEGRDAIAALAPISTNIIIVKNGGLAYLPEWGFNGIGNLEPGRGYFIKVDQAVSFDIVQQNLIGFISFNSANIIDNTEPPIEPTDVSGTIQLDGKLIQDLLLNEQLEINIHDWIKIKDSLIYNPNKKIRIDYITNKYGPALGSLYSERTHDEFIIEFTNYLEAGGNSIPQIIQEIYNLNPILGRTNKYPFYTTEEIRIINNTFSRDYVLNKITKEIFFNELNREGLNIFFRVNTASGSTYGISKKLTYINKAIAIPLIGDDVNTTAVEGFTNHEIFVINLVIKDSTGINVQSIECNTTWDTVNSIISNTSFLGSYETNSLQIISNITP